MFPATNNYCNVLLEFKRVKDREERGREKALVCVNLCICENVWVSAYLCHGISCRVFEH